MFKVLVVDDETIARNSITILLSKRDDIDIVEQADNGESALKLLQNNRFDIVFLDIQMPKLNGLELANHMLDHKYFENEHKPQLIFVTAFNQYAVDAFEVNAIDYLLKPFGDRRFHQALDKAITQLQAVQNGSQIQNMHKVLDSLLHNNNEPNKTISLRETGKIKIVDIETIQYVKGSGNYVEIMLMDGKVLLQRETLKSIQTKLPRHRFSRIHKSTIVRNDLITELSPTPKGDYKLTLATGNTLRMSRRNKDLLSLWL